MLVVWLSTVLPAVPNLRQTAHHCICQKVKLANNWQPDTSSSRKVTIPVRWKSKVKAKTQYVHTYKCISIWRQTNKIYEPQSFRNDLSPQQHEPCLGFTGPPGPWHWQWQWNGHPCRDPRCRTIIGHYCVCDNGLYATISPAIRGCRTIIDSTATSACFGSLAVFTRRVDTARQRRGVK